MAHFELVTLARNVEAIEVPSGQPLTLEQGMEVRITQALGGSYTVTTDWGGMARVNERDADALGKEPPPLPGMSADDAGKSIEELVWDQLRTCYDPEIPVNIVDLGLIYACTVLPLNGSARPDAPAEPAPAAEEAAPAASAPEAHAADSAAPLTPPSEGDKKVSIVMTLTAPGCGMGDVLRADVQRKVLAVPSVKQADVELVIDPPWEQSRMSEAARLQLGLL